MSEPNRTYRRGQLEWALWRQFSLELRGLPPDPPPVFRTRVKRLLDIDRSMAQSDTSEVAFAFSDGELPGKGTEQTYSAFDAFCVAVALDMLDSGFKQSEVVFIVKHVRSELRRWHQRIVCRPMGPERQARQPDTTGAVPTVETNRGAQADWRVFMLIKRLDFARSEDLRRHADLPDDAPLITAPVFLKGVDALRDWLNKNMWPFRRGYVAEIAKAAWHTTALLEQAPEVRRGRS